MVTGRRRPVSRRDRQGGSRARRFGILDLPGRWRRCNTRNGEAPLGSLAGLCMRSAGQAGEPGPPLRSRCGDGPAVPTAELEPCIERLHVSRRGPTGDAFGCRWTKPDMALAGRTPGQSEPRPHNSRSSSVEEAPIRNSEPRCMVGEFLMIPAPRMAQPTSRDERSLGFHGVPGWWGRVAGVPKIPDALLLSGGGGCLFGRSCPSRGGALPGGEPASPAARSLEARASGL